MLVHRFLLSRSQICLALVACLMLGAEEIVEKKASPQFQQELDALRREYPDPFQAALSGRKIAERLLKKSTPGTSQEAEARLLAAAALDEEGTTKEARNVRLTILREGPENSYRARAALELGYGYLLRDRYESAWRYWRLVPRLDPESTWARKVERYQRYFDILASKEIPPFQAEFTFPPEAPLTHKKEDFLGQTVVLFFWDSQVPRLDAEVQELKRIHSRFGFVKKSPLKVLAVNLDRNLEIFEAAVQNWAFSCPQHHDGRAFSCCLARAFGIPRLPHWFLMGADGRIRYQGTRLAGKDSLESVLFLPESSPPKTK